MLRNENVSSAIVGASRPEQIAENVKALDVVLEPDFVEAIEKALEPTTLLDPGFTLSPETGPGTGIGTREDRRVETRPERAHLLGRVGALLLEDPGYPVWAIRHP